MKISSTLIQKEIRAWMECLVGFIPGATGVALRRMWFRFRGLQSGEKLSIGYFTQIVAPENATFGSHVQLGEFNFVSAGDGKVTFGDRFHTNRNVTIVADFGEIVIGNDVLVGMGTLFRASNHRFDRTPEIPINSQGHVAGKIEIGNDVWIGGNVSVLSGAKIGNHCIIAAGAVVASEIPSGSVAGGVPAKVIKTIFSTEVKKL